jgi:heme exporter protein C
MNWRRDGYKALAAALLIYTVVGGFLLPVPEKAILNESIRNLYFHVPMWFGMLILFVVSAVYSLRYLKDFRMEDDLVAYTYCQVGIVFGVLGLVTGAIWANFTWGEPWSNDPKQNTSAIALLIYLAYMVLRNSIDEEQQRAKVAAVFNVFAFAALIPLIFILPRLTDSLHPGSGGNPGFNAYDLDHRMRMVFYPAVLGWALLGVWMAHTKLRILRLQNRIYHEMA